MSAVPHVDWETTCPARSLAHIGLQLVVESTVRELWLEERSGQGPRVLVFTALVWSGVNEECYLFLPSAQRDGRRGLEGPSAVLGQDQRTQSSKAAA